MLYPKIFRQPVNHNRTYDDEDRLTSITLPDGHTDTFSYNGLGMRLTKNDPTGSYAYLNDGLSPASPMLTDGYSTFTPGISEMNALGTRFYLADASGHSRGLLNGSSVDTDGYNWEAFGNLVSRFGNNPTGFAWNVDSGYQADADDGLALLGHRYYDKRTGRFISQDPAGAGRNWYAYVGNNPVNHVDPLGLWINSPFPEPPGASTTQDITDAVQNGALPGETYDIRQGSADGKIIGTFTIPGGSVLSWSGYHILVPPGVSLANNISRAAKQGHWNPFVAGWFYNQVKSNKDQHLPLTGPNASWDYKQLNPAYATFGNFNYGATGGSIADQNVWTEDFVLRMAGEAQVKAGTSQPSWGSPLGAAPFGDDPADQAVIKAGWGYYQKHPVSEDLF